mgnify:CR=1 FL=1
MHTNPRALHMLGCHSRAASLSTTPWKCVFHVTSDTTKACNVRNSDASSLPGIREEKRRLAPQTMALSIVSLRARAGHCRTYTPVQVRAMQTAHAQHNAGVDVTNKYNKLCISSGSNSKLYLRNQHTHVGSTSPKTIAVTTNRAQALTKHAFRVECSTSSSTFVCAPNT